MFSGTSEEIEQIPKAKPSKEDGDSLVELVSMLASIDETNPLAELNATTIADNNGGRIVL